MKKIIIIAALLSLFSCKKEEKKEYPVSPSNTEININGQAVASVKIIFVGTFTVSGKQWCTVQMRCDTMNVALLFPAEPKQTYTEANGAGASVYGDSIIDSYITRNVTLSLDEIVKGNNFTAISGNFSYAGLNRVGQVTINVDGKFENMGAKR